MSKNKYMSDEETAALMAEWEAEKGLPDFIVTERRYKGGAITNHYAKRFENEDDAKLWAELEVNDEFFYTAKLEPYQ